MELLTFQNQTRGTLVVRCASKTSHTGQRLMGLLLRPHLASDEGLWVLPCRAIHTIGMRFPIDAIFLNRTLTVVGLIEGLRPYRIGKIFTQTHSVLELPTGVVADTGVRVGDQLTVETLAPVLADQALSAGA